VNIEAIPSSESFFDTHWRLVPGIRARARSWDRETVLYFDGAGETMVVSELGAVAVDGISAGCSTLAALERWCRNHGFVEADQELRAGLETLLGKLLDLEIIELSA
jgi:hypothetical protein